MRRNFIGSILQKVGGMLRGGRRTGGATTARPTGTATRTRGGGIGSMIRRFLR